MTRTAAPLAPVAITRAAFTAPTTADEATRSIDLVIATEAPVDGLVLRCQPGAVATGAAPVPVLLDHTNALDRMAGRLTSLRFDRGQLIGRAQFSDAPGADDGWAIARAGCAVSVGASYDPAAVQSLNREADLVPTWTLRHAALVPQGADPNCLTRSNPPASTPMTTSPASVTITTPEPVELDRAAIKRERDILRSCSAAGLDHKAAQEFIDSGKPWPEVVHQIISERAAKQAQGITASPASPIGNHGQVERQLEDALVARLQGKGSTSVGQLLEGVLQRRGSTAELLRAAMTTSDFPVLFAGSAQRILRDTYDAADLGARLIARRRVSDDLRDISLLGLSEFPELREVLQGGEVELGAFSDRGGSYTIREFARRVKISRRALLSDNLGAFEQALSSFGRALALLENQLVVAALEGVALGANVMEDGLALFHASHANSTTATVLSLTSLTEALQKLRNQPAPGTTAKLNLQPAVLLVPATVEVLARQLTTQITPALAANVNPFSDSNAVPLRVIADANLGGTHGYVCTAPESTATALEITTGPANAETMAAWDVETTGMSVRVLADRGLGVRDWRGIVRIPLS